MGWTFGTLPIQKIRLIHVFLNSVPNLFLVFGANPVKERFPKTFVQFIPNNSQDGEIGLPWEKSNKLSLGLIWDEHLGNMKSKIVLPYIFFNSVPNFMKYLGTHHAVGSFRYSISPNVCPPNNFLFLCTYNQGAKFLGIYLGQINPLTWDSWNSEGLSQTWFFQFSPKNIGTKIEYVNFP